MKLHETRNLRVIFSGGRFSVGWEDPGGLRYHFWVGPGDRISDYLYKNPPHGAGFGSTAYFKTRYLNPKLAQWPEIIQGAMRTALIGDMFAGALRSNAEAEAESHARYNAESARVARLVLIDLQKETVGNCGQNSFAAGLSMLIEYASDEDVVRLRAAMMRGHL